MAGEFSIKKDIVEVGRRLWQRQYVAANDGNISVKLNENEVLTTPTGVSKGFMSGNMIVKVDMDGKLISSNANFRPSSEINMHLEVYKQRPDVKAVLHAHPVFCTAFAAAGIALDKCILPEAIVSLGAVPLAPFALPSTTEVAASIRPFLATSDAILLKNHGAITFGRDLFEAYYRMETLEHSASVIWHAEQIGSANALSSKERGRLLNLREKYGLNGPIKPCKSGEDTDEVEREINSAHVDDDTIRKITKKVIERLK